MHWLIEVDVRQMMGMCQFIPVSRSRSRSQDLASQKFFFRKKLFSI